MTELQKQLLNEFVEQPKKAIMKLHTFNRLWN